MHIVFIPFSGLIDLNSNVSNSEIRLHGAILKQIRLTMWSQDKLHNSLRRSPTFTGKKVSRRNNEQIHVLGFAWLHDFI